ncbi:MAG TPA: protocatechuate 3,4-dioxygenase [Burkholderiaceae bacterium]|nr:protocatechuate 3,4-dioxygenase [Burkholderiaceae bacterium]
MAPWTTRRQVLVRAGTAALVGAPACAWMASPHAAGSLRPTPSQSEGPFYPVEFPADSDADLLRTGDLVYRHGVETWVEGRVSDVAGVPVKDAVVEIWQGDHNGHYHHPGDGNLADKAFQGFGRSTVQADGTYRFRTLRPVRYAARAPHIHVKVRLGRREILTTQLYVAGDAQNASDPLLSALRDPADRAALTVRFEAPQAGGPLKAWFPIVLG